MIISYFKENKKYTWNKLGSKNKKEKALAYPTKSRNEEQKKKKKRNTEKGQAKT